MKHTKEFYILVLIPIIAAILTSFLLGFNITKDFLLYEDVKTEKNESCISFIATNKNLDLRYNQTWITTSGINYYITNKSEFDKITIGERYICDFEESIIPFIYSEIRNCKKEKS